MKEPIPIPERWIALTAEYEARWPRRPDDWIIAGTVGITVGDLRELAQYFRDGDPHPAIAR